MGKFGVLEEDFICFLRILWCDSAGLRRVRCVTLPAYRAEREEKLLALERDGLGLSRSCMALTVFEDVPASGSGLNATGEIRLKPDLNTARQLSWAKNTAIVMAVMWDNAVGGPWACCPRSCLQRVLDTAAEQNLGFMCGFETEFILCNRDHNPMDSSPYCSARSMDIGGEVLGEMVLSLEEMGITVVQFHPESAPGQFEIATGPCDPIRACDDLLLTRETIVAVARRYGYVACLVPKLLKNAAGNGCHCHMSLWSEDWDVRSEDNGELSPYSRRARARPRPGLVEGCLFAHAQAPAEEVLVQSTTSMHGVFTHARRVGDTDSELDPRTKVIGAPIPSNLLELTAGLHFDEGPTLDPTVSTFMAGLLTHLPALLSITAPSPNSFRRLAPGCWSGAYACWGVDNREAPLRLCSPAGAEDPPTNMEIKCVDATANPHVAVAALIAAGLDGIARKLPLAPHTSGDPGALSERERREKGIWRLPTAVGPAVEAMRAEEAEPVRRLVGEAIVQAITAVHSAEDRYMREVLGSDTAEETDILYDKY